MAIARQVVRSLWISAVVTLCVGLVCTVGAAEGRVESSPSASGEVVSSAKSVKGSGTSGSASSSKIAPVDAKLVAVEEKLVAKAAVSTPNPAVQRLSSQGLADAAVHNDAISSQDTTQEGPVRASSATDLQATVAEQLPALGSPENPIKVGLLTLPPFVIEKKGHYAGLVVAYWEKIAAYHGWHYKYLDAGKNYTKAINATAEGSYDLMLGNFSTTFERSQLVDFSRPFLLNYASVLTESHSRDVFWTIVKVLKLVLPVLIFLFLALCCITVVFFFSADLTDERGFLVNAFCALMALMRMGGYVQKPCSAISRVVVLILAFFSVFFMATFSAVMTDALLILEKPQDPFVVLSDIKGKTFIVAEGSSFVDVVHSLDGNVVEIPDAHYAVQYYFANRSKYDGFVGDHALVHEFDRQLSSREIMQSAINLRNDELVFLYHKGFPYQRAVDQGIMRLQDKNISVLICAHYLGVDSRLCIL